MKTERDPPTWQSSAAMVEVKALVRKATFKRTACAVLASQALVFAVRLGGGWQWLLGVPAALVVGWMLGTWASEPLRIHRTMIQTAEALRTKAFEALTNNSSGRDT